MKSKGNYRILGIFLFLIGIFFLINSKMNMTGAAVGISIPYQLDSFFGLFFIGIALVLFAVETLEEKVHGKGLRRYKERLEKEKKEHKVKIKTGPLKNIKDAVEKGMLANYLAGKRIIYDTAVHGKEEGYTRHTDFVGRDISEKEFLEKVGGKKSEYAPIYSIDDIHEFERRAALKGRGYSNESNKALVYGISHPKRYGPVGAYRHERVFGLAVDVQEKADGIHIHGHPIPIEEIPKKIKEKILK